MLAPTAWSFSPHFSKKTAFRGICLLFFETVKSSSFRARQKQDYKGTGVTIMGRQMRQ
jgi:hypothetical protein